MVARIAPALRRAFDRIRRAIGTPLENSVVEEVYQNLQPVNFSRTILASIPGHRSPLLLVLPVRGVEWSDWGSEQRIIHALGKAPYLPPAAGRGLPAARAVVNAS
ncbi:MAG: hypothetical protein AB1451_01695 [Nitrospirota bacterium]